MWTKATQRISSIEFSPSSEYLLAGLFTGELLVCSIDRASFKQVGSIKCRNRRGKFSKGRKISGIQFVTDTEALVTTNDSRIRLISIVTMK